MRNVCLAVVSAAFLTGSAMFGQNVARSLSADVSQNLSVTNYQYVSEQRYTRTTSYVTYRADLLNRGAAQGPITATVTSLAANVQIVPGQDTLLFPAVGAGAQATSLNTFTILVDRSVTFDFATLQWSFQLTPVPPPIANPGPNQSATVGSVVTLNGGGSTNPSGVGVLSYSWAFVSAPAGSTATLSNPNAVIATFVPDQAGSYVIALTVSNGSATGSANVTVSTTMPPPPVANAGANQTVATGATVVLNGSGSTSGSGKPITYAWTLTSRPSGSAAVLSGANTVAPTFVADKFGSYTAQLIVNDTYASSAPSTVMVTTQVVKPVAKPGPDQVVNLNSTVTLDGTKSSDANGLSLTYQWSLISLPASSAAVLSNPTAVNPTFVADRSGAYVAQLIVHNGFLSSDPATVTITTNPPLAPTADAGSSQTVPRNSTVTLSGNGTDPQSLPLSFQWTLITKPAGSSAVLSNATSRTPSFIADLPGDYVAQLIVSNGVLSSAPATVMISTTSTPPVANAGANQTVAAGATATLDGSASADPYHDQLSYAWSFTTRPNGSAAALSGASSVTASFVADLPGVYVVQLIVKDAYTSSAPATVTITAQALSLSPDPLNLTNAALPLTITLSNAAGVGGQLVNLSSSNTNVASTPASVTVPEGASSATVQVTPGSTSGSATLTATAANFRTATAQVNLSMAGITVSAPDGGTVGTNRTTTVSITLGTPAPASGLQVALSAAPAGVVDLPATVQIAAGSSNGSFTLTGLAAGSAVLTATAPNYLNGSANVTVALLGTLGAPASPVTVGLGQSATFAISLPAAAPTGGVNVTLTPANGAMVSFTPSTVFIPAGATIPAAQPQVKGLTPGSVSVNLTAAGYTSASQTVQVTANLSFTPPTLAITGANTQNLVLTLSGPAPAAGLTVNLSSSNPAIATVGSTVAFAAGATTVNVPVKGVAVGGTVIHASALPTLADASATVTVSSDIILPVNLTVQPDQRVSFPVSLASPAASGGVFITLTISDPAVLSIVPLNVYIEQGQTQPPSPPDLTGIKIGSVTVTATASGFLSSSQTVQVVASNTLKFSPATVTFTGTGSQNLTLTLTSPAPASGLTVNLKSDNTGVATVAATVSFLANAQSVTVPVNVVAAGSTVIRASALPGVPETAASVTVSQAVPASITADSGSGQSTAVSTAFPTPLSVTVKDASNNPIPSVTVTFTGPASGASITTATATTNASGVATATVTANATVGGPYTVTATVGSVNATFQLTNTTGAPASMTANSGSGQSTTVSTAFATPLSVTVKDASNNPISGATVTFTGPASGAGIATVTATTNASGVATATVTANATVGGPYTVTASTGSVSATFQLTNTAGAAASMTANSGSGQSTAVSTAFATPLSVTVKDASNNPVSGATVTFTGPASGAGITTATATTNASGVATATVTANATVGGPYTVTATTGSVSATFQLTNTAGAAATVTVNSGSGQSTAVSTAFPTPLSVTVKDASNNPVSGATVTFTGPASGASITTATATTNASGVATATVTANATVGGPYTVTASTGSVSANFQLTNTAGAAATVTVNSGSGQSAAVSTAFATPLSVTVKDVSNNPISGATVTFAGPASGAGIATVTATTNASGVATATVTANATVGGPYTVTATAGSVSANFQLTNTPGAAATVTVNSGSGQSAAVDTAFPTPLSVTVKDAANNVIPGVTVTFAGPATGAGIVTATATTNAAGIATATVTANAVAGGPYTATATAASVSANFQLTNTPGAAASVAANSGGGQSAPINTAFAAPLSVTVKDAENNPLSGVTVSFAGPASGAGIATVTAVTNASGVATATVTANATAGGPYTVTATTSSVSATFQLTNTPGAAATVTVNSGSGQSATISTAFAAPLAVTVKDAGNNPISGATVTFAGPASGAGVATVTAVTNAAGVASATVTANATAGGPYTVTASTGSVSATFQLTNLAPTPATVTVNSGSGQSATISTAFATPLAVTVKDAGNNPIAGASVTFAGPASGAGVATVTAVTNAAGVASATVTANTTAGGPYTVTATAGSVSATFQLTNTVGAPATIVASSGSGQSATVGSAFASPLVVTVRDAGNNALSGVTVSFTGPASGAGIVAGTAVTNASGVASATVTANATAGGPYAVTAAVGSLSAVFSLTNVAVPSGPYITVTPVSVGQNLETTGFFTLSTVAGSGGVTVNVTSSDPSKLLVATGPAEAGLTQASVLVGQGSNGGGVWLQSLASSGTVTITASAAGYVSGAATITLTPSGFAMAGPFGSAQSFTTNVGATATTLTLTPMRLDASLAPIETQYVRGGYLIPSSSASGSYTVSVPVTSSTSSVGTAATAVFAGGSNSATTSFTPGPGTGSTTLTATAPSGFTTPASGNTVTAVVNAPVINCSAATVGKTLQTTVNCSLVGGTPSGGSSVVLTSDDPSKLLLAPLPSSASSCTATGSSSIVVTTVALPGGGVAMPGFCVYGLTDSGAATYSINGASMGYGSSTGNVTLAPSGVVIAGPGGIGSPNFYTLFTGNNPVSIYVYMAQLDASGNFAASAPLAGGVSAVTVAVTSATPAVGTITTSPVTIPSGGSSAVTQFLPVSGGSSLLSLSTPAGYSTASSTYRTVTANVPLAIIQVDGPSLVGQNLQASGLVRISPAPASDVVVTLTSQDPSQLLLSSTSSGAGLASTTVTVPAGSTDAYYYVQATNTGILTKNLSLYSNSPSAGSIAWDAFTLQYQGATYAIAAGSTSSPYVVWTPGASVVSGASSVAAPALMVASNSSGTAAAGVSYSISAPSYGAASAAARVMPSGVIFTNSFVLASAGSGAKPVNVATVYLDSDGYYVGQQSLRGGVADLQVLLTSSVPTVGTIGSPIAITAGSGTATSSFIPLQSGFTTLSIAPPAGLVGASNKTSLTAIVQ